MKVKQKYFERDIGGIEWQDGKVGKVGLLLPQETFKSFVGRVNKFIRNRADIISIQYEENFCCCVVVYEAKKGE